MKAISIIGCAVWTVFLLGSPVRGQFGNLPSCASSCLSSPVPDNCDSASDVDCICQNLDWDAISSCVCGSCNSSDQKKTLNSVNRICDAANVAIPSTCPSKTSSTKSTSTRSASRTRSTTSETETPTSTDATETASATAASASSSTPPPSSDGLSAGARAGVGIGATFGALAIVAGVIFFFARHLRKSRQEHEEAGARRASQNRITWADGRTELPVQGGNPFAETHEVTDYRSYSDSSHSRLLGTPSMGGSLDLDNSRELWLTSPQPGLLSPGQSVHHA